MFFRNTWIEINLDNLKNNIAVLKNINKDYKYFIAVVKANAYSHGDIEVSKALVKNGVDYLATSSLEESLHIRKNIKNVNILCLEIIEKDDIKIACNNNITMSINSMKDIDNIIDLKSNVKFHIKIDTGMNRLGIKDSEELNKIVEKIKLNKLNVEGIYTHMATADSDDIYYDEQLQNFKNITRNVDLSIFKIIHIANSASLIGHQKLDFVNGFRTGIALYGINPVDRPLGISPVLSLYSKVINIKHLKKDESAGYDRGYIAKKDEIIAVIPIGYADGIIRNNSGRFVIINNKKYEIVSNICMDILFVKIDDTVKIGDKVGLICKDCDIFYIADYLKTITYEVICSLSDRIQRIYIMNNKVIKSKNFRNDK